MEKPKVVFVLGGPGAGKGTQCSLIIENFPKWAHISAGDCLRAERQDPESKVGEMINEYIKEGKIVPVAITVGLLQKAMAEKAKDAKSCFLIDGFPRNLDNVTGWQETVGDAADVKGVLFYECPEEELEKRLLGRGETSGRVDDNIESIRKRFRTFMDETMPIVNKYKEEGLVASILGTPPVEQVWEITQRKIRFYEGAPKPKVVFVLGGPGAGKGTQCSLVIENFPKWAHVSAGDCLRAERTNPSSKVGEMINEFIKEGKIVPVAITVGLLQKAMDEKAKEGKTCFLIDGFPRNLDNVTGWQETVGSDADVVGVLFYECPEAELEKRLLGRGETSGRVDDNIESIRKRFRTFMDETVPIVNKYKDAGKVCNILGTPPPGEVWEVTQAKIKEYEAM